MIIIDLKSRKRVAEAPSGTYGQISFTRLVEQLRAAGEFKPGETITHLRIDAENGFIGYRVERWA